MNVHPPEADGDENRVVITGTVCKSPETRQSPAGISLTRFTLEHQSSRRTAGVSRQPRFRIVVVAAEGVSRQAVKLVTGDRVRVTGYLSRSDYRRDERHVTLHAETLTIPPGRPGNQAPGHQDPGRQDRDQHQDQQRND